MFFFKPEGTFGNGVIDDRVLIYRFSRELITIYN
jgi:hypothetical protein